MGTELAEWTREITQMDFFEKAIAFTAAQMRRESELEEKYDALMDLLFINSDEEECSIIQALLRTKIKGRVEGLREITMKYPM